MSASAALPFPAARTRSRSLEARRAARARKVERERLIVDYLNRGISVAEIAARTGVTEKRMRAIVREILARRMPAAPEDFVAVQVSRLNEALLVAYGAMSGRNLKAVGLVVRIVRELDRYHGFFAAARRSTGSERASEPTAGQPAMPAPRPRKTPSPSLPAALVPAAPPQEDSTPDGPGIGRPQIAWQAPENARSAPGNGALPHGPDELFAPARRAPDSAPGVAGAPAFERAETAPQAPEKVQSAPGNGAPSGSPDEPFRSPLAASAEAAPTRASPSAGEIGVSPLAAPEVGSWRTPFPERITASPHALWPMTRRALLRGVAAC